METVKVSCFPNEGEPEVISGEPVDGDLVRITVDDTIIYERFTEPKEVVYSAPREPTKAELMAELERLQATVSALDG